MYLYAGKVVWGGPPGVCLLKNAGVENKLVWIHLCMFSWSVGDYICQYTPSAIAHSLIPRQSRQWFSPGTNAVIKVHFSTLKHTFLSAEVVFIWKNLDKQTFFYIIAVAVGLRLEASHLFYSIQASHPQR